MAVALLLNEIYYVSSRKRLDLIYGKKDVKSIRSIDVFYYLLKVFSVLWPVLGLFGSMWPFFLGFISLGISKFVLYHISEKVYAMYVKIHPYLLMLAYTGILYVRFIR